MIHHPPHPPHEWIQNEEKRRPITEIGERLQKIGSLLEKNGELKLGDSQVKPNDPSYFIIRYERMPHGELSLKLEIRWEESIGSRESVSYEDELPLE